MPIHSSSTSSSVFSASSPCFGFCEFYYYDGLLFSAAELGSDYGATSPATAVCEDATGFRYAILP